MNRSFSLPFLIMGVVFCVCLICSNLLEVKMISLGGITATAGLIVFPISYIINDCIAEVWGVSKSPTHYLARIPDELNGYHLYTDSDYITIGSILGRTEIVRNRIFINTPHLISKFHSFPRRLLFERLCHE